SGGESCKCQLIQQAKIRTGIEIGGYERMMPIGDLPRVPKVPHRRTLASISMANILLILHVVSTTQVGHVGIVSKVPIKSALTLYLGTNLAQRPQDRARRMSHGGSGGANIIAVAVIRPGHRGPLSA